MRHVTVGLAGRSYEVVVGRGLLADPGRAGGAADALGDRRVFLASDRTVWGLYGQVFSAGLGHLGARIAGHWLMDPGEAHKEFRSLQSLWDALVDARVERGDCLVALGGGVVGDLAGFAAATYRRGVDVVQVPTTLLAMVDSSVGGKTAVDHPRGKNLIGAFHQPRGVVADLDTLRSLPGREVLSGFAEVLKASLLADPDLFARLEAVGPALIGDPEGLEDAVARAVTIKARIVEADETETGARALLNLGHTLGHAVEAASGYGVYAHGEAVALGIGFTARLSQELGFLPPADAKRIRTVLEKWGYPLRAEGVDAEKILNALRFDKKNLAGVPRWVLLEGIGSPRWGVEVDSDIVERLLVEVQKSP